MTKANNISEQGASIDLLDFLFTVALSVGLTPEVLQIKAYTGLLSTTWAKLGVVPVGWERFDLIVFVLGILTLTLSWFGYHASIKSRPLQYKSAFGMARFVIDIVLVLVYGIMLIYHKRAHVVLFFLMAVYWTYVIWDLLKICEYWSHFRKRLRNTAKPYRSLRAFRREFVSVFWVISFSVLYCLADPAPGLASVLFAIVFTITYRINKVFPIWERLLGVNR